MKYRAPDYAAFYAENKEKHVFRFEPEMAHEDVRISVRGTKVFLSAEDTPVKYVRLRWNFQEHERRRESIRIMGDFYECEHGILGWRPIMPDWFMPWYCMVSNGSDMNDDTSGRFTECFGVRVRPAAIVNWQYDGAGITLWCDVRNGGSGVMLGGRELLVCEIVFCEYRDMTAFESGQRFCHEMCDAVNPVPHKVYGSNNWYYAYGKSSEEEILEDARIIAKACEGLENRPYMVIDDGWEIPQWEIPWRLGNERFPDMPGLAQKIKAMGVRPGIWVHLLIDQYKSIPEADDSWRLMRDPTRLDASNPAVIDYVKRTIQLLCDWGYQFIKHDMSTGDFFGKLSFEMIEKIADNGWHFYDRSRTSAEIIVEFYRAIAETADKNGAVVLGCGCIPHLGAGLFHVSRVGSDTSGVYFNDTRKYGVNSLAFRLIQNGAFYAVDADCVGITEKISWKMNRQWMDLLAHSASPLFVSCKPGVLSDGEFAEMAEAMRVNSVQENRIRPVDWMENDTPMIWEIDGRIVEYNWYEELGEGSWIPEHEE